MKHKSIIPPLLLILPLANTYGQHLFQKEWIETNGLGNVISGTTDLANTRNYHGIYGLLNTNGERITLVNNLEVKLESAEKQSLHLSSNFYPGNTIYPEGYKHIDEFTSLPYPIWKFKIDDNNSILKEILYIKNTNKVVIRFQLIGPGDFTLKIRPLMSGRSYFGIRKEYTNLPDDILGFSNNNIQLHLEKNIPAFYISHNGTWRTDFSTYWNAYYPLTDIRHEEAYENLLSPGEISFALNKHFSFAILQFCDHISSWQSAIENIEKETIRRSDRISRVNTSDQRLRSIILNSEHYKFIRNDNKRSILAGFPWFLDWGRDTFISLEGLLLTMGEINDAHDILKSFAQFENQGLLPNMFPTLNNNPVYNSVDAPLWFIHAAFTTLEYHNNIDKFNIELWPTIKKIINAYIKGTLYNIKLDPTDGLIYAGASNLQLTWMDAKVGNWVVTPRRGKPIEISSLWYHALKNSLSWAKKYDGVASQDWKNAYELIKKNFQKKYYSPKLKYLTDLIDSPDPQEENLLRPNVIFALNFASDLLSQEIANNTLQAVKTHLLTPYGLRSLAPFEKKYIGRYEGSRHERDSAYHQGTTWAYLIGFFIDAVIQWQPDITHQELINYLNDLLNTANTYSIGHIYEIFDGDSPWKPAGCFAQAWSDAEILRITHKLKLWSINFK